MLAPGTKNTDYNSINSYAINKQGSLHCKAINAIDNNAFQVRTTDNG